MMDERSSGSATFIIQDLDEHHLLIKADEHERVKRELEAEVHRVATPFRSRFLTPFSLPYSWRRILIPQTCSGCLLGIRLQH